MKERMASRLAIVLLVASTLSLNCCMLTLGTLGALVDEGGRPRTLVPGWNEVTVRPGSRVTVVLKDGHQTMGKYVGMMALSDTDYASQYVAFLEQRSIKCVLPALGDTLKVVTGSASEIECIMTGLDYESICINLVGEDAQGPVRIGSIMHLGLKNGPAIDLNSLRRLLADGEAPCRTVVMVKSKGVTVRIRPTTIEQVVIHHARYSKYVGVVVGAALDGLVLAAIASTTKELMESGACFVFCWPGPGVNLHFQ